MNLIDLDAGVGEDTDVVDTDADDLNRVSASEGVVDDTDLEDKGENEKGHVSRDRPGFGVISSDFKVDEAGLERSKHVALEGEGGDGLDEGDAQEGPRP